jgi:hypothetical protein
MHQALGVLFTDQGYTRFLEFCENLLSMRGLNDKTYGQFDGSFAKFVAADLRDVRDAVWSNFDSALLDDKVNITFGGDAALAVMVNANDAMATIGRDVTLGSPSSSGPSRPHPRHRPTCRHARPASNRQRAPRGGTTGASAGYTRTRLKVDVHDDEVFTSLFKFDAPELARSYGRAMYKLCLPVLLRRGGLDTDCPTPDAPGHE